MAGAALLILNNTESYRNNIHSVMNRICKRVHLLTAMAEASTGHPSVPHAVEKKESLKRRRRPLNILCLGITGSGKSSIVNAMMGEVLARTQCVPESCQSEVECHKGEYEGIRINVYDTVGFSGSVPKDRKILKNISDTAPSGGYNVLLLTLRMDCRFDEKVFQMLSLTGKLLKPVMWQRTILVLTFANAFVVQLEEGYQGYSMNTDVQKMTIERTTVKIKELFQKHSRLSKEIADSIPIVLAGSANKRQLPTDPDWLLTLWNNITLHCKFEQKSFLKPSLFRRLTKKKTVHRHDDEGFESDEEITEVVTNGTGRENGQQYHLEEAEVNNEEERQEEDQKADEGHKRLDNDSNEHGIELPSLQMDSFFDEVLDKVQ